MSLNYAAKYASKVDERFIKGSLTNGVINQNFDWIGVQTVKVFSRDLVTLGDYSIQGANRYGSPNELGNNVQEMTLTQDKAFTYTIDRKSEQDTNGTMEAAATLAENIDNVLIPAIDKYRIAVLAASAPSAGSISGTSHYVVASVSASSAYEEFLKAQEVLDNDLVPQGGRVALVTPKFFNYIKLDESFVKRGDMATRIAINGVVGEIDGVPIIKVPASYFPNSAIDFIITNPIAMVSPIKLQDFKIHVDPPGINGFLIEARLRHDAFVLDKKADAIVVHISQKAVTLDKTAITLGVGDTATLVATTYPTGQTVTWSSSAAGKASVSNGVVTGVEAGSATITATVDTNKTATCAVTVA